MTWSMTAYAAEAPRQIRVRAVASSNELEDRHRLNAYTASPETAHSPPCIP
jgi:hypothetical protein